MGRGLTATRFAPHPAMQEQGVGLKTERTAEGKRRGGVLFWALSVRFSRRRSLLPPSLPARPRPRRAAAAPCHPGRGGRGARAGVQVEVYTAGQDIGHLPRTSAAVGKT